MAESILSVHVILDSLTDQLLQQRVKIVMLPDPSSRGGQTLLNIKWLTSHSLIDCISTD